MCINQRNAAIAGGGIGVVVVVVVLAVPLSLFSGEFIISVTFTRAVFSFCELDNSFVRFCQFSLYHLKSARLSAVTHGYDALPIIKLYEMICEFYTMR